MIDSMTDTPDNATATADGAVPEAAATDEGCAGCVKAGERVLAGIGLLAAALITVVALDVLSGGALSRAVHSGKEAADAGSE
jgi:hypothetical protein